MAAIKYFCPECGLIVKSGADMTGQSIECLGCKTVFVAQSIQPTSAIQPRVQPSTERPPLRPVAESPPPTPIVPPVRERPPVKPTSEVRAEPPKPAPVKE